MLMRTNVQSHIENGHSLATFATARPRKHMLDPTAKLVGLKLDEAPSLLHWNLASITMNSV
jgi:hypothetical protein